MTSSDAASPTCATERFLRLRQASLVDLYLLGPPSAAYGQTIRVAAGLELGGCERLADVHIQTDEGARRIEVTGLVWEEVGEGDQVELGNELFEIVEVLEVMPSRGEFGYLHMS